MSTSTTLYRFRIQVSDIDRGFYDALDFRIAMHPSETHPFLLSRVLAYALNAAEGLKFSPGGLSDPDSPCLEIPGQHGGYKLWIEIGNPSTRKLHKASKAAQTVKVYTYKDPNLLLREMKAAEVHKAEAIEVFALGSNLLDALAETLERDNDWHLTHSEGSLILNIGDHTVEGSLVRHTLT